MTGRGFAAAGSRSGAPADAVGGPPRRACDRLFERIDTKLDRIESRLSHIEARLAHVPSLWQIVVAVAGVFVAVMTLAVAAGVGYIELARLAAVGAP
jgi:hypothetical protein